MIAPQNKLIFFDDGCILCNSLVQFIIKRDKKAVYNFGSLYNISKFIEKNNIEKIGAFPDSIVYWDGLQFYIYSDAILKITLGLGGLWKIFYMFYLIPRPLRDLVYRMVAANRTRFFGRTDHCITSDEILKKRFLE